jgi:hypothetical protein
MRTSYGVCGPGVAAASTTTSSTSEETATGELYQMFINHYNVKSKTEWAHGDRRLLRAWLHNAVRSVKHDVWVALYLSLEDLGGMETQVGCDEGKAMCKPHIIYTPQGEGSKIRIWCHPDGLPLLSKGLDLHDEIEARQRELLRIYTMTIPEVIHQNQKSECHTSRRKAVFRSLDNVKFPRGSTMNKKPVRQLSLPE